MLLRRAVGRAALPLRISTNMNRKTVGKYPVPAEASEDDEAWAMVSAMLHREGFSRRRGLRKGRYPYRY